jgi:hypothetical protein
MEEGAMRLSLVLLLVLSLLLAAGGVCFADEPSPLQQAYGNIKGIEATANDLFPAPYGEVTVGTFDAATGIWDGLASAEVEYSPAPGKPERTRIIYPVADVNAVLVGLVFRVTNREGEFSVRINNGAAHKAPAGAGSVTVRVGRATSVKWTVSCRGKTYSDTVKIARPPQIGAGAFTIPALPITIIYDPPQDRRRLNLASYSQAASLGTTASASFSSDTSTTKGVSSEFETTMDFRGKLSGLADGIGKIKSPYAAAISGGLKLFASGMGSVSSTQTNGRIEVKDHQLVVKESRGEQTETSSHLGPGMGDTYVLLRNARLIWLCNEGQISLALLGWDSEQTVLAKTLRDDLDGYAQAAGRRAAPAAVRSTAPSMSPTPRPGPKLPGGLGPRPVPRYVSKSGLDEDTIRALVSLDPFIAGGPGVTPPSSRFVRTDQYDINGAHKTVTTTYEIASTGATTGTDYQTWVDDYNAGWLSAIGIGPSETKKVKSTFMQSASKAVAQGFQATAQVDLYAEADEFYSVTVYYDTVFGSFAFRQAPTSGDSVVTGVATGADGQPASNQMVTLTADGKRFTAFTDATGRYVFHASEIPNGAGTLSIGALRRPIRVTRVGSGAAGVRQPRPPVLRRLP